MQVAAMASQMASADVLFKQRYIHAVNLHHSMDMLRLSNILQKTVTAQSTDVDYAKQVYTACNSIAQRQRARRGKIFEKIIERMLEQRNIPYISQVSLDNNGVISQKKRGYVHDIIVNAKIGDKLSQKIVISCKTSLRERYKQDTKIPCRLMYMVTLDNVECCKKYSDAGIKVVSIGTDNALEKMMQELEDDKLVEEFVDQLFNIA